MTSWKVEAENRGRKLFRISLLSLLTSMVLSLGCGVAMAEEPTKLWVISTKEVAKHLEAVDFTKAENWLTPGSDKVDFKRAVEAWSPDALKLIDAAQKAAVKAHDANKAEEFKTAILEKVFNDTTGIPDAAFGTKERRDNFKKVFEAMMKLTKEELKNSDWLKTLLRSIPESEREAILRALGLTETNPNATPTPTPTSTVTGTPVGDPTKIAPTPTGGTPDPKTTPTAIPNPSGASAKDLVEANQKLAAQQAELDRMRALIQKQGGSFEVNDSALQAQAKQVCDQLNALRNGIDQQLANAIAPIKDLGNQIRNEQVEDRGNDKKKDRFKDLAAQLAAQQQNQNKDVAPPPAPVIPPSKSGSSSPEPVKNLTDGLQQAQNEPTPAPQIQVGNVSLGKPTTPPNLAAKNPFPTISKAPFNRASGIVDENTNRPPLQQLVQGLSATLSMVGPNPMAIQAITGGAKAEIQEQIDKTKAASVALGKESARLDNLIDQAKDSLKSQPYTPTEQAALKNAQSELERKRTELNRGKATFDQTIAQAQQVGDQAAVADATAKKAALEDELKPFEEAVKNVEEAAANRKASLDSNVQALVKYQGQVDDKKSEVDSSMSKLNNEMKQVDTIGTQFLQQANQPQQAQGAPVQPANTNRTSTSQVVRTQPGGTGGVPSALLRGAASSTASTATPTPGGAVMRGKLGQ